MEASSDRNAGTAMPGMEPIDRLEADHAMADGTRSRFLQAELEFELGDAAMAKRLFRGFDESWSPWDGYHRALAFQRLGQIAEAEGRVDDALRYYGLLIDLWRDCDEDLVPLREEIRERRDGLASAAASDA